MGKRNKRKGRILKIDSSTDAFDSKSSSLFDDGDYDFDNPAEPNEWNKLYMSLPSELDDLDPAAEYRKAAKINKSKRRASNPSSFFDLDDDEYDSFPSSQVVYSTSPIISPQPEPLASPPHVQATVRPASSSAAEDEEEVKDRALRIAEDFVKHEKIILVGGVPCIYNGKFFTFLRDDDAQRRIFAQYRTEIGQSSATSVLRNAVSLLKLCPQQVYDEFPANPDIIVFENGTLEVTTGHFRKNSPYDLASSALGVCYDPDQKKMPWTKQFLSTIADGDDELYELMLQVIGYILSNDVKAKSFFYLEGVGDAGKSRFCDLIASFFPISGANKVARIALQDLGGKFALGNLVNAKLNISEDLPDSPLSPTTVSRIKMISDANRLEAEAKYVQPFSFRPLCKLLFASNHPLRLKEYDAAFVNRVVYIPFLHPIPKERQDKHILEKMQAELPALFNHAFKAYRRLVANGYIWSGSDRFKPQIAVANSGISINKEVILQRFVSDCCEFEYDAITPTTDLQSAYNQFCHKNTYMPVQGDRFSRELAAMLPATVTRVKIGNQRRGYKGIRLKAAVLPSEFEGLDEHLE